MLSSQKPSVIRFRDLEPSWHVLAAKEPGYMRWLISWVGGRAGFVNANLGKAVENDEIGVGYMHLPIGQRQKGLHYHSITEIYVILKGHIEGYDGTGETHRAGPMDCISIPAGIPHGVRNCGSEDVELIWLHDGVEAKGVTVYCHTEEEVRQAPSKSPIQLVRLKDLEPCWKAPRAKEPEFLRWVVNWIGGPAGFENLNVGTAVESKNIAVGLTVLMPGHKQVPHYHTAAEVYIILRGTCLARLGQKNTELGYLDGVYFPAGNTHSLRNHGTEPVYVLWVHDRANHLGGTCYIERSIEAVQTACNGVNGQIDPLTRCSQDLEAREAGAGDNCG